MRLTKKTGYLNENPIYSVVADPKKAFVELNKVVQKLGQLEDAEDELGIDLITLFKALKQGGVYVKEDFLGDTEVRMSSFLICGDNSGITIWSQVKLNAKDYGKTWALTKEELIDEDSK